jgi:hypothetical protein
VSSFSGAAADEDATAADDEAAGSTDAAGALEAGDEAAGVLVEQPTMKITKRIAVKIVITFFIFFSSYFIFCLFGKA